MAITTKVAVLVETRVQPKLIPLLVHFAIVLGPTWPIIIYTYQKSIEQLSHSSSLARHIRSGQIQLRTMSPNITFPNTEYYSEFLTRKSFWEELAPAEHVLIFQSDSVLCAAAPLSVDDFFEWDFIGAPIDAEHGHGYNGGLSLRKWSSTMRVLNAFDWYEYRRPAYEDQWYYQRRVIYGRGE